MERNNLAKKINVVEKINNKINVTKQYLYTKIKDLRVYEIYEVHNLQLCQGKYGPCITATIQRDSDSYIPEPEYLILPPRFVNTIKPQLMELEAYFELGHKLYLIYEGLKQTNDGTRIFADIKILSKEGALKYLKTDDSN